MSVWLTQLVIQVYHAVTCTSGASNPPEAALHRHAANNIRAFRGTGCCAARRVRVFERARYLQRREQSSAGPLRLLLLLRRSVQRGPVLAPLVLLLGICCGERDDTKWLPCRALPVQVCPHLIFSRMQPCVYTFCAHVVHMCELPLSVLLICNQGVSLHVAGRTSCILCGRRL